MAKRNIFVFQPSSFIKTYSLKGAKPVFADLVMPLQKICPEKLPVFTKNLNKIWRTKEILGCFSFEKDAGDLRLLTYEVSFSFKNSQESRLESLAFPNSCIVFAL
jgi:hypothetical protein